MSSPWPVTFVRPYEESVRRQVMAAVEAAGGRAGRVFVDPVDVDAVRRYLERERDDRLVIPFHKRRDMDGIEIVAALHDAGGVARRIVMPVKFVLPSAVESMLAARLPAGVAARVLVRLVDDFDLTETRDALRRHLADRSAVGRT